MLEDFQFDLSPNYPDYLLSLYSRQNILFFDIETSGFDKFNHQIICIGLIFYDGSWQLKQFWATTLQEEKTLLSAFLNCYRPENLYITFNGNSFDFPFLKQRLQHHFPDAEPPVFAHLDFLSLGRTYAKDNGLRSYGLKHLESIFGFEREDDFPGQAIVQGFLDPKTRSSNVYRIAVLKHNALDVYYSAHVFCALGDLYPVLLSTLVPIHLQMAQYTLALKLSFKRKHCSLTGEISPTVNIEILQHGAYEVHICDNRIQIQLPLITGKIDQTDYARLDWDMMHHHGSFNALSPNEKAMTFVKINHHIQHQNFRMFLEKFLSNWL